MRAAVFNGPDLWIVDLERSVPMRFATSTSNAPTSVWSPDGTRIAFISKHDGRDEIHVAGMDGRVEVVSTNQDIWTLSMTGERKAAPYLRTAASELGGKISLDGRWLAYQSNETGQDEVYVQSYPTPGHKVRVSPAGGKWPRWVDGGRSLRYGNGGAVVTVPVTEGEELTPGAPHQVAFSLVGVTGAAALPDGNLHLVSIAMDHRPSDILLVLDWTALLGR